MPPIVAIHFLDRFDRPIWPVKGHQAFSGRHIFLESCTLCDHGSAGCQVANRSVAEPSWAGACGEILSDGELAARRADIGSVAINIQRHRYWGYEGKAA